MLLFNTQITLFYIIMLRNTFYVIFVQIKKKKMKDPAVFFSAEDIKLAGTIEPPQILAVLIGAFHVL